MAIPCLSGVIQIQAELEKIESLLKAVIEAFEDLRRKVNEIEKSVEDKLSQLSLGEETQPASSVSHEDKYEPCEYQSSVDDHDDDHDAEDNRDLYDSDFESMINPEA